MTSNGIAITPSHTLSGSPNRIGLKAEDLGLQVGTLEYFDVLLPAKSV
jgi:hypothetical protein